MEGVDTSDVSIILPVYNAAEWLDDCLQSILHQSNSFHASLELSAFNDASTDGSVDILKSWKPKLEAAGISVVIGNNQSKSPGGVGFAKNRAIAQCHGKFLCFQDADDIMHEERIALQYKAANQHPDCIIGCCFKRDPPDSTVRYTKWCNTLTQPQLIMQVYTSHGPTVVMPTWFCSRAVFDKVGAFDEGGKGVPEDLIFFLAHLKQGGGVYRVDISLLTYRYHQLAATHSIHSDTIWRIRIAAIQDRVLSQWSSFTIWNAGKQGRRFYRSLSEENKEKVAAFCDVDVTKINKGWYTYEESQKTPKPKIPIVHFSDAKPPFIICVKLDLTGGGFESNLSSLNLTEGIDYYHFS